MKRNKKKKTELSPVNTVLLRQLNPQEVAVELRQHIELIEEAECDELWSFVGGKAHQRWLWYGIDHATGKILAYVLGSHKDEALIVMSALVQTQLDPTESKHYPFRTILR